MQQKFRPESEPTGPERDAATEERMLALLGYLIWPIACTVLFSVRLVPHSPWLKRHALQAIVLGAASWFIMFVIFSMPLFIIMTSSAGYESTIGIYQCFFVIYGFVLLIAFAYAVLAARRARRGEVFSLLDLLIQPFTSWKLGAQYQPVWAKMQAWLSARRN